MGQIHFCFIEKHTIFFCMTNLAEVHSAITPLTDRSTEAVVRYPSQSCSPLLPKGLSYVLEGFGGQAASPAVGEAVLLWTLEYSPQHKAGMQCSTSPLHARVTRAEGNFLFIFAISQ